MPEQRKVTASEIYASKRVIVAAGIAGLLLGLAGCGSGSRNNPDGITCDSKKEKIILDSEFDNAGFTLRSTDQTRVLNIDLTKTADGIHYSGTYNSSNYISVLPNGETGMANPDAIVRLENGNQWDIDVAINDATEDEIPIYVTANC